MWFSYFVNWLFPKKIKPPKTYKNWYDTPGWGGIK